MEIKAKNHTETNHPGSAEIVASNDDLLTTILLRLPMQSLLRFKSVSKYWLSLISNPIFCSLRNPNPNPAVGLFLPLPDQRYEYVPFCANKSGNFKPFIKPKFKIFQSCNGLMLCCDNNSVSDLRYSVYNPTTGGFLLLPKIDETNGFSTRICGMNLVFDPMKSPHYGVVVVLFLDPDPDPIGHRLQIRFYSSKTRSWRICGEPFSSSANFEKGVYCNGAVHWLCTIGDQQSLYFNTEKKKLFEIPNMPLTYSANCKRNYYFGESCGHVHLVDMRGPKVKFNVYELKSDYSDWFVKYRVDISAVVAANPGVALIRGGDPMRWCGFVFSVSAVVRGETEEDSFLVLQIPEKAIRYNVVEKSFENLIEFEGAVDRLPLKHLNVDGFQYIQSICCV